MVLKTILGQQFLKKNNYQLTMLYFLARPGSQQNGTAVENCAIRARSMPRESLYPPRQLLLGSQEINCNQSLLHPESASKEE